MLNKFTRFKYLLRHIPFDPNSESGRAQERKRRIFLTTASSGFSRVLTILISLVVIPLTLKYLGVERFGLWMTISSAVAMLGFSDLGVGNSVMNAVAYAHGKDDTQGIKKKIEIGFTLLTAIGIFIFLLFFLIYPYIDWVYLFNVSSFLATKEIGPTLFVVVLFFSISIPSSLGLKVMMGLQLGFFANLWQASGSGLSLIAVLVVIYLEGGLAYLAIAIVAPPVAVAIIASIYLFYKQKPFLKPNFASFEISEIKSLANTSWLFFVLQISGLIAFQSDNLIIAHYLGSESVAAYAIAFKLFSLPTIIMSLYLNAMWPAYAEAKSRGDHKWIYNAFRKSIRYSILIVLPITLVLLVSSKWLIQKWVGPSIMPSWDLLLGLFFWTLLTIFGGNFSVILNGLGVIKFQVITSILMATANIAVSIFLVQRVGLSGVIWGSVITLIVFNYIPTAIYLRSYFHSNLGR